MPWFDMLTILTRSTMLRVMVRRDRTMSKVEGLWSPEARIGTGAYPYIDMLLKVKPNHNGTLRWLDTLRRSG